MQMMDQKASHNRLLRFSDANFAGNFEECANEHLLDKNLCPNPGLTAEILRDYMTANNYPLDFIPSSQFGIDGTGENGSTMQFLALGKTDFAGFAWTYCIRSNNIQHLPKEELLA